MLRLITGAPGAGKSLRAMWWLTQPEYQDENGEPRPVYSNIPGTNHLPLPENDDWTKTPEGSVVIYDEAQQFFPATGRAGNSTDPRIQALETHRHTGHDLIFLTQRYALIHHHIRGLCGEHEHLLKKTKRIAVIFKAGEVFDPRDRGKNQTIVESTWKHPADLFDSYHSSSMHTKAQTGFRIPGKLKALALVLVPLVGWVVYEGGQTFENFGDVDGKEGPAASTPSINETSATLAQSAIPGNAPTRDKLTPAWQKKGHEGLSGCVASDSGCQCFDNKGLRVDLPENVCRNQIEQPMISRITGFDGAHRERRDPDDDS